MIPQNQTEIHDPANGKYGDCYRACLASILELPIEDVPHFLRVEAEGGGKFWDNALDWLKSKGLCVLQVVREKKGDAVFRISPDLHYIHIISYKSSRNPEIWHSVVGCNGNVVFDPHPYSNTETCYLPDQVEYEFLIPISGPQIKRVGE